MYNNFIKELKSDGETIVKTKKNEYYLFLDELDRTCEVWLNNEECITFLECQEDMAEWLDYIDEEETII